MAYLSLSGGGVGGLGSWAASDDDGDGATLLSYDDGRALYYQTMKGSKIGKEVRKGDFLRTASYQKQEPGKYDLKGFAGDFYNGSPSTVFSSDAKSKTFK